MNNIEIKNKYEEKLRNVGFDYLTECLFDNDYTPQELYNELSRLKENISLTDLEFIYNNYKIIKSEKIDLKNIDIEKIRNKTDSEILKECEEKIKRFSKLNMIYIRVSTKNNGQEEEDQLPDIINTFNLDLNSSVLVAAKESAFQEKKDKNRKFNIFYGIIEKYKEIDKTLYVWDLDRIYRNQKKQAYFISFFADKNNCKVLSYRQKYFHQFKSMDGMGHAMYNFLIEVFGWMAEEESKKKSDRLKKSLTKKEDGFYTNKNNKFGRKLIKSIKKNGEKVYFNKEEIEKINNIIIKLRKKGYSYEKVKKLFLEKKNIKFSDGYIANVMKNA